MDTKPHAVLMLEDCILQTNLAELVVRHLECTADGKVRAAYAGKLQLQRWATCLTAPLRLVRLLATLQDTFAVSRGKASPREQHLDMLAYRPCASFQEQAADTVGPVDAKSCQEGACKQLATAPAPTAEANRSAGGDLMAGYMLLDVSTPRWRLLLCDDLARAVAGGTC